MHTTIRRAKERLRTGPAVAKAGALLTRATFAAAILLALLIMGATALPALMGYTVMVVTSNSMAPSIQAGDAVWIRSVATATIDAGDVVTFSGPSGDGTVTHRVVKVTDINGERYFQTKGDANQFADPNLASERALRGQVAFTAPKAGYLLSFFFDGWGMLVIIGTCLVVVVVRDLRGLDWTWTDARNRAS